MEKKYVVKVNEQFDYEFTKAEIESLDVQNLPQQQFHILKNNRSFKSEIVSTSFNNKRYEVKINGNIYRVNISNQLDVLMKEMGLSLASSQKINDIKAPMPGLILDVIVKEGDEVKQGDYLLVLEAMKMENTLTAPRDGVVKSVSIKKGDAVDKNQLLIEME